MIRLMMCLCLVAVLAACGEDVTGADVAADTELQQSDAGQVDADQDDAGAQTGPLVFDGDLSSLPAECQRKTRDGWTVTHTVRVFEQVVDYEPTAFEFEFDRTDVVEEYKEDGWAMYLSFPSFYLRIETEKGKHREYADAEFFLYRVTGGERELLGSSWVYESWTDGGPKSPNVTIPGVLPGAAGLPEGAYAIEVKTGGRFILAGDLSVNVRYIDWDCLD